MFSSHCRQVLTQVCGSRVVILLDRTPAQNSEKRSLAPKAEKLILVLDINGISLLARRKKRPDGATNARSAQAMFQHPIYKSFWQGGLRRSFAPQAVSASKLLRLMKEI